MEYLGIIYRGNVKCAQFGTPCPSFGWPSNTKEERGRDGRGGEEAKNGPGGRHRNVPANRIDRKNAKEISVRVEQARHPPTLPKSEIRKEKEGADCARKI